MSHRRKKLPVREELEKAIDEVGGEPLEGSGFEAEMPEPEFSVDDDAAGPPAPY